MQAAVGGGVLRPSVEQEWEAGGVTTEPVITAMSAAAILSELTGESYVLHGPLFGGETGAHRFSGPDGRPLVIKWDSTDVGRIARREGVGLSERLRLRAGWPIPAETIHEAEGITFIIQEFMAGSPPEAMSHALIEQLLELHRRRMGMAEPSDVDRWSETLITTLTHGGTGYCRHDALRGYTDQTRSLIERVEHCGADLDPGHFGGEDIVHWDLHPGNLLVLDGQLSAVIDTDFAMIGDGRFDLVMIALTSLGVDCEPDVTVRLFSEALDPLDELTAQAYLAHLFVRLIDWPIRRSNPAEVDFWLLQAQTLLTI